MIKCVRSHCSSIQLITCKMKSYARKMSGGGGGPKSAGAFGASAASSTTSAAAVTVTKFGQATFTSIRRNDYENGTTKFVPLQSTVQEGATPDVKKEQIDVKPPQPPKPKVFKFFKSRAPEGASSSPGNKSSINNATTKAVVLNSTSKDAGVKRITATIGRNSVNHSNRNSSKGDKSTNQYSQPTAGTTTISLSPTKSCEIKICGDKTFKKVISPTKTTQFVIRNSNVRNATVKPAMATPTNVLPVPRGVRASRRLKGIEPEHVNKSIRKTQTVHLVYDKSSSSAASVDNIFAHVAKENNANNENEALTTMIEESKDPDSDEEVEYEHNGETGNTAGMNDHLMEPLESAVENEKDEEAEKDEQEKDVDKGEGEKEEETEKEEVEKELVDEVSVEEATKVSDQFVSSQDYLSADSQALDFEMSSQSEVGGSQPSAFSDSQPESKSVTAKPKKKIFSNRDRSKVEFNTKSFFNSAVKDEFDMDLEDQPPAGATSSNADKKNGHENDEDPDQFIKLKRIKKAHQCHDLGETEQFDEDIKYYLSGIVATNTNSMRCLSIIGLAQNAMRPEFRMHLRAHDDMPRIIKALMDAPQDPNLAICTATLMFVYSQDRLTMDIDPNALSLILDLLETRSDECHQAEEKHRVKLEKLVEEMKNKGHAKYLKLTEITAGKLAMETLLGLTSKRAGDWFKVEFRKMKGIDFIVDTVLRCAENYDEEGQMVKIDRCMHVLENVTFDNVENQLYITSYSESKFILACIKLLENCKSKIISSKDSKVYLTAFFSILRVFTNLTSESVDGCKVVGSFTGIFDLLLESFFELPNIIIIDQRFDLMVIILCLCVNLVEFCEHIREIVMTSEDNMTRLSEFLFKKIEEAAQVEQQTDHLLESHETVPMTEAMQDNLLTQMISKSGTHMEHSLLAACVCLLFGCCIQDNDDYMHTLKDSLPNNSFDPLIEILEKLRDFAHLADVMTQKGKDRVQRVLQIFKMYK